MIRNLGLAAFVAGLGVVAWVGYGYVGSNMLALAMTLLIAESRPAEKDILTRVVVNLITMV